MKRLLVLTISILILGCQDKKEVQKKEIDNNSSEQKMKENKKVFSFTLEAIIENDGIFTLFFLEEGQTKIIVKNSKILEIKGATEPQILSFKIKEEIIPDKLFLRFVNDEKKQIIDIKTTTLSYGEKSIIIQDSLFYKYFMPNKFIEYDNKNFRATTKAVEGDYLPRFRSREVLIQKMWTEF